MSDISHLTSRVLLKCKSGQTKKVSTTTEGESYLRLAQGSGLLPPLEQEHFVRVTTEDDALDSFQNLLFSIARFHEYTGHYPSKITVVGFEIKRRRFTELHRAALRWPEAMFHYVGIDVEGEDLTPARNGEVRICITSSFISHSVSIDSDKMGSCRTHKTCTVAMTSCSPNGVRVTHPTGSILTSRRLLSSQVYSTGVQAQQKVDKPLYIQDRFRGINYINLWGYTPGFS